MSLGQGAVGGRLSFTQAVRRQMGNRCYWKALFVVSMVVFSTGPLLAKRASDYIPPPYATRFLHSLIGLAPLTAAIALLTFSVMLLFRSRLNTSPAPLVITAVILWIAGSLLAALDGLNDELWEPSLGGSVFIAFLPSITLFLALKGRRPLWQLIPVAVLAIPTWFAIVACGIPLQVWAAGRGLPVSW